VKDNRRAPEKTNLFVFGIVFLGGLLIVAAMVLLTQRYTRPAPVDQARIDLRRKTLAELRAASTNLLNSYAWRDQAKGIVRVPITRALELAEQEWRNPAAARSNLIARAERANAAPTANPSSTPHETNNPIPNRP